MRKLLVLLAVGSMTGLWGVERAKAAYLYAANPNDITVKEIDAVTGQRRVIMGVRHGLTRPTNLAVDAYGNVYATNADSPWILKYSRETEKVSFHVYGGGTFGTRPQALAFSPEGDLFIGNPESIYKLDSDTGVLSLFGSIEGYDQSGYNVLEGMEFDAAGNLYCATSGSGYGGGNIVKFDSIGTASVIASGLKNPRDLSADGLGNLYVANNLGEEINKINLSTGDVATLADLSAFSGGPRGIATDLNDNVYALNSNGDIRKWDAAGAGGSVVFTTNSSFSTALAFSSIPEPSSLALIGLISGGALFVRRRFLI